MGKKVSQIRGGIILSYASMFIGNAVSIVYTPIMIRLLGQSEYGLYNLVASIVAYLGLFNFGFDNTYLRFYTQYKVKESKERVASLNGIFLLVFSVLGVIAAVCGFVLTGYVDEIFSAKLTLYEIETAKKLMVLLIINIAIMFPANLFKTYVNANERFVFSKTLDTLKTVINPFIVLPLLLMGYKSYALVFSTLIISVISDIIYIYYAIRKLQMGISFTNMEFSVFKGIAAFAFFIFLGEIVDEINWQLDKFLLGKYCGTIAVAIYGVAASLSTYFRQFSMAISGVFSPRVNRIVATDGGDDQLTNLMIKVGRIQYIILSLLAVGFVFCGQEFCILWAGKDYAGSYPIAVALLIPSIIPLIQNVGISILVAKNKHKFRSIAYFFIALLNLGLSVVLCQKYEGLGCAIGTGISMLLGNGILINLYYRKLGINIGEFWKSIASLSKGLLIAIALGVAMLFVHTSYGWLDFFIRAIVLFIGFVVGMYLWGMNKEEKELIYGYVKKILHFNITQ